MGSRTVGEGPASRSKTLAENGHRGAFTPAVILFLALREVKDNVELRMSEERAFRRAGHGKSASPVRRGEGRLFGSFLLYPRAARKKGTFLSRRNEGHFYFALTD